MSTESSSRERRRYRKRRRAELEAETRLRITEAAMELHGTVGPARTTISAVAERAGVQRATVYRHFADESELFDACSAHWMARHPLPDPAAWEAIEDPDERLRAALSELYEWYERSGYMLERTTRDVALVPSMRRSMELFGSWYGPAADALVRGRPEHGARLRRVRAAVGHAMTFETWRSLVRREGLSQSEAVAMMARMTAAAAAAQR